MAMERFSQFFHLKRSITSWVMMTLIPLLTVIQRSENVSQNSFSATALKISECSCDGLTERYVDTFLISAKPGLIWEVTFKPDNPVVSFIEVSGGYKVVVSSTYRKAYELSVQSSEFDTVVLKGGNCGGNLPTFQGATSVCLSTLSSYSILSSDTYSFSLSGGGTLSNLSTNKINILWGATPGTYTITAQNTSRPCMADIIYEVTTGSAFPDNLACRNQVNFSLDGLCEKKIMLSDVLINQNITGTSVALVLKSENGTVIPGNILTKAHVGKTIVAEAIDGCGNNSCRGTIRLEDKSAPTIICLDTLIMECFKPQDISVIANVNDCSNYEIRQTGTDQKTNFTCDPQYLSRIIRRFQATDQYGNTSEGCTTTILVRRFPLDSVKFPENKINDLAYDCNALTSGSVLPSLSGYPTIQGIVLDKNEYPDCNILITYKDRVVQLAGKTKISRLWEITEWYCNQAIVRKSEQLIEVNDKIPPSIANCPATIVATTDIYKCSGLIRLPAITSGNITDNCSQTFTQNILINNIVSKPGDWVELPSGSHQAVYIVADEAGNTSRCTTNVVVEDKTSPVAICNEYIVMSLSNGGGYITTMMIDNGSKDECALDSMQIRRVNDPSDRPFRDTVHVSCADAEKPFMVMLRVKDKAGNINQCISRVLVQDKSVPQLQVPADLTIDCMEWTSNENPKRFGEAQVYDPCNFTMEESVNIHLDNCKTGTIVRTFTVKDASHTIIKSQTITVRNNASGDLSGIKAPRDTVMTGMCTAKNLHPDSLARYGAEYGRPQLPANACYQSGISWKDEIYTGQAFNTTNCFKIIRIWKIVNWCATPNTVKELKQIISVENNIAPTITMNPSDSIFHAVNCESGTFSFSASGSDDCTPPSLLGWTWRVLNKDNQVVISGEASGSTVSATGIIPSGQYTMLWLVRDGCGNVRESRRSFRIQYTKGASFFLVDDLSLSLTPNDSTNSACITASKLVMSASHPCKIPVTYSFSPIHANQDTLCFDCRNLGNNHVTVYAHDAYGMVTSARSVINVQDNNLVRRCDNTTDCVIWPKDTTINACTNAISPAAIGSQPIIKSDCNCNIFTLSHTDRSAQAGNGECTVIERTHFVTFRCNGIVSTYSNIQRINRRNAMPVSLSCPNNVINAASTSNCMASVTVSGPQVLNAGCHTGLITSYRIGNGANQTGSLFTSLFAVGSTQVVFTVTDVCGNTGTCMVTVNVTDGEAPVCNVKNVEVFLNQQGIAVINDARVFDNGSRGSCSPAVLTFSVDRSQFSCKDLSRQVPVEVTVSSQNGRFARCSTNVMVKDTIKPKLTVQNITREITNLNQIVTISPGDLIISSSDNCFIADSAVSLFEFTCANTGQNVVNVSIRDSSGNSAIAQATVTIFDRVPPTCNVKDVTIYVNSEGQARIEDASVFNAGASTGCSGAVTSYSVNKSVFSCADTGRANPVIVTLRDNLGNTMTCNANVFVEDTIAPLTTPRNIEVFITESGQTVTVSKSSLIQSITENCSVSDTILSKSTFSCEDAGDNRITIQVIDASGNRDTAEATVTVTDRQAPVCRVRNVSINLNNAGLATIGDASVFNAGSFDECGSLPLRFSVNKTQFSCADLGNVNPVIITTTDAAGNSSTCAANVTVADTVRPVVIVRNISKTITDLNTPVIVRAAELIVSATDNCSVTDSANAPSIFDCTNLGNNTVRVIARDASGNVGSAEAVVNIIDGIAPVCRLKSATIMVNGGITTIDSSTVDNGSFDPCGTIRSFKVSPSTFTCQDKGEKTVTVTITDFAGNVTICDTTVTVTDANQLVCVPKDITVTLDANNVATINASDLDGGSGTGCGNPVDVSISKTTFGCSDAGTTQNVILTVRRPGTTDSSTCIARVTVVSNSVPQLVCVAEENIISCDEYDGINIPASVPRPFVTGTCSNNFKLDSTIIRLRKGCNLDTLTRTYLLFDLEDNLLSTCVQSIYIINNKPLTLDSFNLPQQNVTLNSCADKSPELTGGRMTIKPGINPGCSDVEITFRDTFFLNTCNDTLRRIWTATDKCGSFGPLVFTQLIIISDTFPPLITGIRDTIVYNQGDCGVNLDFTNISVSDCDTRLTITNNSPHAKSTSVINPAGFYPIGNYTILLTATDACGNSSQSGFSIQVRDTLSSSLFCRSITKSIGSDGTVNVEAREMAGFAGAQCLSSNNLRVVMSRNNQDTISSKTYTCNDLSLINGEFQKADTFKIQVFDGNDLLHTCNAFLRILGGQNCQNFFFVNNQIRTINEEVVPDFNVGLWMDGKEVVSKLTNEDGMAKISVPAGKELMIVPTKNDDYLNGVNTLDLVQIQRHILGINKFKSPYQMLAADVNNDKKISVADIVDIRNLILGIKERFDNHTSWIAIDSKHQFESVANALEEEYPQVYNLDHLRNEMLIGFTGVKIGDVDISYTSKVNQKELQYRKNHTIELQDRIVTIGEEFDVEMGIVGITGGDISLNTDKLKLISYSGKNWAVSSSEHKVRAINYDGKKAGVLSLRFKAESSGLLSELLQLSTAEVYDEMLSVQPFAIHWMQLKPDSKEFLHQLKVYPNPSAADVFAEIMSENENKTEITITDHTGKTILKTNKDLEKGLNKMVFNKELFGSAGIYYLRVNTSGFVQFSKLIITE
jgi:hypothetical protein